MLPKSRGTRAAQDTLLCSSVASEALPLTKDKQLDPSSVVVTSMGPNSVKAGGKNYALSATVLVIPKGRRCVKFAESESRG